MHFTLRLKSVLVAIDNAVIQDSLLPVIGYLLSLDCHLTLCANLISPKIQNMVQSGIMGLDEREFDIECVNHHLLILCGLPDWCQRIYTKARAKCIWTCIMGGHGDFELPRDVITPRLTSRNCHGACNLEPVLVNSEPVCYLVGAGPGAADLLTLRALNLIKNAEVVIADRLVSQQIIQLIPKNAKLLFTRKVMGKAIEAQDEISRWILEYLHAGISVVRLKGGDPFLFGRGGEELNIVAEAGFKSEYIPGVSSISAAGIAGIPLTHRGVADQVLVATGKKQDLTFAYIGEYNPTRTLVLLMAIGNLELLTKRLMLWGYPRKLPVAVVHKATWPDQKVVYGVLDDIYDIVKANGIFSHSTLIVGHVVNSCLEGDNLSVKSLDSQITL
jgi:uroporphyrin-III C-methyltransferase